MKLLFSAALLFTVAWAIPASATQLISNPGIEGTAGDGIPFEVHQRNTWNGAASEPDSFDKWWTGANGGSGHSSTGGNSDGYFNGHNDGYLNRFQIIDNTTTQASGPAVFSVDRRWYDDQDPKDPAQFLGVRWKITGINGTSNLPSSLSMTSGSGFGLGDGTGTELASYNFNDITKTGPDGDGIYDTGSMGTEWDTQATSIDLGASPYDYLLISFRAGSTEPDSTEVIVGIDNITLTTVPEPTSVALLGIGACVMYFGRRRV